MTNLNLMPGNPHPIQSKIVRVGQTMIQNFPISVGGMLKDQIGLFFLKTRKYFSAGAKEENSVTGQFMGRSSSLTVKTRASNHDLHSHGKIVRLGRSEISFYVADSILFRIIHTPSII